MAESLVNVYDLTQFRLTKILSSNSRAKTICVLGKFVDQLTDNNERPAIILLEKTAFTEANVSTLAPINDDKATANTDAVAATDAISATDNEQFSKTYFCSQTELKQEFTNDIYGQFQCFPSPDINSKSIFYHILSHFITFCSFVISVCLFVCRTSLINAPP